MVASKFVDPIGKAHSNGTTSTEKKALVGLPDTFRLSDDQHEVVFIYVNSPACSVPYVVVCYWPNITSYVRISWSMTISKK